MPENKLPKIRVKYVNFAKLSYHTQKPHTELKFRVMSHQNRCTHVPITNKAKRDSLAVHTSEETMLNERIRVNKSSEFRAFREGNYVTKVKIFEKKPKSLILVPELRVWPLTLPLHPKLRF